MPDLPLVPGAPLVPAAGGVSTPPAPGTEGSSAAAGVPLTEAGDADGKVLLTKQEHEQLLASQRKLEDDLAARDRDIRKLKSTYDRQAAVVQREHQTALEAERQRLENTILSGMTDEERREYEHDMLAERTRRAEQRAQELQLELDRQGQIGGYLQYLRTLGLSEDRLDLSSPETLAASASQELLAYVTGLRNQVAELEKRPVPPTAPAPPPPVPPAAPPVNTGRGSSPGQATFESIRAALSQRLGRPVSDAEIFEMARSATGFDLNEILPKP